MNIEKLNQQKIIDYCTMEGEADDSTAIEGVIKSVFNLLGTSELEVIDTENLSDTQLKDIAKDFKVSIEVLYHTDAGGKFNTVKYKDKLGVMYTPDINYPNVNSIMIKP